MINSGEIDELYLKLFDNFDIGDIIAVNGEIIKTKRVRDLNACFFILESSSMLMYIIYGILKKDYIILNIRRWIIQRVPYSSLCC